MVSGGGKIEITDGRDLLILDGECGLCHRLANFVDRRIVDRRLLAFRASDSEDAQLVISKLPAALREADTVYLIRNGKSYIRSAAGIRCLLYMKWYYRMWYPICWLVPLPARNIAYSLVAKFRHKIFSKPKVCSFRID